MTRGLNQELITLGSADDPRLGRRVSSELETADVVLVGSDAAGASAALRRWLYAQTLGPAGELGGIQLADLGDAESPEGVEGDVMRAARSGAVVVFLGGAAGAGCPSRSGMLGARPGRGAMVNVDVELRCGEHGATRALLDRWGTRIASPVVLGVQAQHVSKPQVDYLRSKSGRAATLDELRAAPGVTERLKRELGAAAGGADFAMVSLDMHAAAAVPGVLSPSPDGLSAEEVARFCEHAGRHAKVQLLDVVGLVPEHDSNGVTARLAALGIWRFLLGVMGR